MRAPAFLRIRALHELVGFQVTKMSLLIFSLLVVEKRSYSIKVGHRTTGDVTYSKYCMKLGDGCWRPQSLDGTCCMLRFLQTLQKNDIVKIVNGSCKETLLE